MHGRSLIRLLIVLLGASVAGCHALVSADAYPLYPKVDAGPGPGKVALLRGPIAIVDGSGVLGKGSSFELLPGCHLVALAPSASHDDETSSAANPPQIIFAFEMRPGYLYTIESGAETPNGHSTKPQVVALEHAPNGSVVRVQRARGSDVKECRSWAKSQRYERETEWGHSF